MEYDIITDIETACSLLHISKAELAEHLGVARSTVMRVAKGETSPSPLFLERFYAFLYDNPIRPVDINSLKVRFAKESCHRLLFHGSGKGIFGPIDLSHSRKAIDMGPGFYLGEKYEQVSSYVFASKNASIYLFDADELDQCHGEEFSVSSEWMLYVCDNRGQLARFEGHPKIQAMRKKMEQADYIVAPIADNNMYEIMGMFARGDITDVQASHALSASNLGKQWVLKSNRAVSSVRMLDHLYLSSPEKEALSTSRKKAALEAADKAQLSIEKFRRQGKYIEEMFS